MIESEETDENCSRKELHRVLGYGTTGIRIVNILAEQGVTTLAALRRITYNELLEIPGVGQKFYSHLVTSLEHFDRYKEGR